MRKLALIMTLSWLGCAPARPTAQAEFLIPFLRAGWSRPAAPSSLTARYTVSTNLLALTWTGSLDPDTGQPNVAYRIYVYELPPREFYRAQDLLATTTVQAYYRTLEPAAGTLYFVVTAHDGGAESLPSNTAEMQVSP